MLLVIEAKVRSGASRWVDVSRGRGASVSMAPCGFGNDEKAQAGTWDKPPEKVAAIAGPVVAVALEDGHNLLDR